MMSAYLNYVIDSFSDKFCVCCQDFTCSLIAMRQLSCTDTDVDCSTNVLIWVGNPPGKSGHTHTSIQPADLTPATSSGTSNIARYIMPGVLIVSTGVVSCLCAAAYCRCRARYVVNLDEKFNRLQHSPSTGEAVQQFPP